MSETKKKMGPWTIDASGIDIAGLEEMPYCREALRDFFSRDVGSLERILVAPKGYGKTLYLKYKSHLIRKKYRGSIPIFPDHIQDIEFLKLSLDWKEMLSEVSRLSIDSWSLLWQFVLVAKGLQLVAIESLADPYLKEFLKSPTEPIGDLLSAAIRDTDNFGANVAQRLQHVRKLFNDAGRDAIIFVDNADEMFVGLDRVMQLREARDKEVKSKSSAHHAGRSAISPSADDAATSAEVAKSNPAMWKAAQVGLMLAVREIERSAPLLSVYTSLRAEAVFTAKHPDALQARTYTIPIKYSVEDLEEIFAWHVNMMQAERLVEANAVHPAHRLMGSAPIEHRYVHVDGKKLFEDPFQLVLRHTTFSPRDLVVLGGCIARLSANERSDEKRAERIRKAIDEGVATLLVYFRENAIPRWTDEAERAASGLDSPVVSSDRVGRLLGKWAKTIYSYGLLGVAESTGRPREYIQTFLTQWDDAYAAPEVPLPNADYYFLHPWLSDAIKRLPHFRREPLNVIGSGCIYHAQGPLKVRVGKDVNFRPTIWCEAGMDSPASVGKGPLPQAAVFMFALLLACAATGKVRVSAVELQRGHDDFKAAFPSFAASPILNPIGDREHRSHLTTSLRHALPNLAFNMNRMADPLSFGTSQDDNETYIDANFLDIDSLVIES